MGTSQFPLFHSYLLKAEREREREREREERDKRRETNDTSEQIANEQLIKPFYMPYLATSIFQPVTTTQEFL